MLFDCPEGARAIDLIVDALLYDVVTQPKIGKITESGVDMRIGSLVR
jgi:hypothetical protein